MQLTSFTDYGLRTLIFLAALPEGQQSSIQAVSDRFGIPKNHMIKISHKLSQLGYITSVRGKNGGIRLGQPADKIIVGKVVRDIEPLQIVNCDPSVCHISSACRLKLQLAQAKEAFLQVLDQSTIADYLDNNDELFILLKPL